MNTREGFILTLAQQLEPSTHYKGKRVLYNNMLCQINDDNDDDDSGDDNESSQSR